MFGDVLRKKITLLSNTSVNKNDTNSFWIVLRDIAVEDIKRCYPEKIDSSDAIALYYEILRNNECYIPKELTETLPSNGQEKYRVKNRNMWSSNAFNTDGLANQPGIKAKKVINKLKNGEKIIYQGVSNDYK